MEIDVSKYNDYILKLERAHYDKFVRENMLKYLAKYQPNKFLNLYQQYIDDCVNAITIYENIKRQVLFYIATQENLNYYNITNWDLNFESQILKLEFKNNEI